MRAQVVVTQGDRILLTRHVRSSGSYWVLPGGRIEQGESPTEAAVREMREETGLAVEIEQLLFVDGPRESEGVCITSPRHTFLGRIVGGVLEQVEEPGGGNACNGSLAGAAWMPFDSGEFDVSTRDTLELVRQSLANRVTRP